MRKETIEIFKFKELTEEAKDKARKWYKKSMDADFSCEADMITENMEEFVSNKVNGMIDDLKVAWSLNCCQGDGVSFTGCISSDENIIKFLKLVLKRDLTKNELLVARFIDSINFERDVCCNYCHERSVETEVDTCYDINSTDSPHVDHILEVFQQKIEGWRIALCKELEKGGYEEIDFYNSNECIDENIISNDCEFLVDGTRY